MRERENRSFLLVKFETSVCVCICFYTGSLPSEAVGFHSQHLGSKNETASISPSVSVCVCVDGDRGGG